VDHELELNESMDLGDVQESEGPLPEMIYCESCDAEYPVSHIVDSPGAPEHGKHF
jgi:hypothetical protein